MMEAGKDAVTDCQCLTSSWWGAEAEVIPRDTNLNFMSIQSSQVILT